MFSFQIFCATNVSANCPLHSLELNRIQRKCLARPYFLLISLNNSVWDILPENSKFQVSISTTFEQNWQDKNLACLIEFNRVERANDKNVREFRCYLLLENTFLF